MSVEIFLRDYGAIDLNAMFRLDEACFAEEFRFDRESMREFAEEKNAIVRIAEKVSGEMAGFVIVHVEHVVTGRRAYVVTLDVAAECRQQGVGRRLIREAEALTVAAGERWIQQPVLARKPGARRLHVPLGYEQI